MSSPNSNYYQSPSLTLYALIFVAVGITIVCVTVIARFYFIRRNGGTFLSSASAFDPSRGGNDWARLYPGSGRRSGGRDEIDPGERPEIWDSALPNVAVSSTEKEKKGEMAGWVEVASEKAKANDSATPWWMSPNNTLPLSVSTINSTISPSNVAPNSPASSAPTTQLSSLIADDPPLSSGQPPSIALSVFILSPAPPKPTSRPQSLSTLDGGGEEDAKDLPEIQIGVETVEIDLHGGKQQAVAAWNEILRERAEAGRERKKALARM